jgi:hypothetical protein
VNRGGRFADALVTCTARPLIVKGTLYTGVPVELGNKAASLQLNNEYKPRKHQAERGCHLNWYVCFVVMFTQSITH